MTNGPDVTVQHFPIRAVARLTGLSVDTLRAWERRYEAVVPLRNERGRVYTRAHVDRLTRLATLVDRGHAIGGIATLSDDELATLLQAADTQPQPHVAGPPTADVSSLIDALDRYDLATLESALYRHAVMLTAEELVFGVVLPLLRELGVRWQNGTLRPSQEHLLSEIVRNVLGGLLRTSRRPERATARIVFATLPGEQHELGLLCAALLTASAGYDVLYLGPNLPAGDIMHAAVGIGARVIVLSATSPSTRAEEIVPFETLAGDVDLWIGGPSAPILAAAATRPVRVVERLDQIAPMLTQHVR